LTNENYTFNSLNNKFNNSSNLYNRRTALAAVVQKATVKASTSEDIVPVLQCLPGATFYLVSKSHQLIQTPVPPTKAESFLRIALRGIRRTIPAQFVDITVSARLEAYTIRAHAGLSRWNMTWKA